MSGISKNTLKSYHKDLKYFWTYVKLRLGKEAYYSNEASDILIFLTEHFPVMPDQVEDEMIRVSIKHKKGCLTYLSWNLDGVFKPIK